MSPQESEKIEAVYKGERKRLLSYIRTRIPVRIGAEDILHDVFYQLTVGFRDIIKIEAVTAWLYRVADNRITDLYRKKMPVSISYSENGNDNEEQRSVFVATEFEEMSFKEISERTGIGVNTLLSRKRYAVLALRERLNELYKLLKSN